MIILYQDADILAVDKPSGISVHPSGKLVEETVSDWFAKEYPESKDVGEPLLTDGKEIAKPGIVHRLDKDTSGVLLLAKNQKTFEFLKAQFQNREVQKTYTALVYGHVKNDSGVIDAEIGRSKNDPRLRTAMRGKRGKLREAITEYKVLERFTLHPSVPSKARDTSPSQGRKDAGAPPANPLDVTVREMPKAEGVNEEKFTLLELHPRTGRTHQIRVHMKFLNHPIVCDSLYAPKNPCPEGITRLALHASSIEFKNLAGKSLQIESPLPEELQRLQK